MPAAAVLSLALLLSAKPTLTIDTPMPPPNWAVLQRELLRVQSEACAAFFAKYFDDRGYLRCVERWGGDDGPDDAIENINDWPLLYLLGGDARILELMNRAWEGHLEQFTNARTTHVEMARDGMYYKEFPVMFDWLHNGEGLTVFNLLGLCDPANENTAARIRRFAGFYTGDDPGAPNYDPKHRIIRSMINGSRGPMLRKATGLDWAGDPIEVENRFKPRHGESTYQQMVEHFKDYNDVVGDHPQNLLATTLALNAFMLTQDARYRDWLLEYVDAWCDRTTANGGIIPSNVGLDGTIGGATAGKWYGGVYGWGFSVHDPASGRMAHRNTHHLALDGFGNAYLLTGDAKYLDVWRRQIDKVNANAKEIDGTLQYPRMFGDHGWYDFTPEPYRHGVLEMYYWSMDTRDRERVNDNGWLNYLDGNDPNYPENALRSDFETVRQKVALMRADETTPDTRLSDDPMPYNPATVANLVNLMLGGLHPGHKGAPLHSRVRYFDADARRPGLPPDVAALVDNLSAGNVHLTLVNTSPLYRRSVLVQAGAYGEHQILRASLRDQSVTVDASSLVIALEPGCGERITLETKRYANAPTLASPW